MARFFLLILVAFFAYMMWRVVRVMMRTGGVSPSVHDQPKKPVKEFKDIQDADFEEIKKPKSGNPFSA